MNTWPFILLAALALAVLTYLLLRNVTLGPRPLRALRAYRGTPTPSALEAIGEKALAQTPLALPTWEAHLTWLHRHGVKRTLGGVLGQALVLGLLGLTLPLFLPASPAMWLAPVCGFCYPWVTLRGQANKIRQQAQRRIPEVATLLAAELATGTPPEEAVARACALPGPLAALLQEAVTRSQQTRRPLFSRSPVRGTLLEVLSQTGEPALRAFAVQVDLVAGKGVAGAALMQDLARTLGREYHAQVVAKVEKLDSQLTLGVTIFYFAPMILLILGSFFAAILEVF
jgi:tight adherence protein C